MFLRCRQPPCRWLVKPLATRGTLAGMAVSVEQAEQIAQLLNERNELTVPYTSKKVLDHGNNYLYRLSESGDILACVEVKKVQWY